MAGWLTILLALLGEPTDHKCISTVFGTPGDKLAGGDALYLGRRVNDEDMGIAHRTLPGNAPVVVYNHRTAQWAVGQVVDRGPYGAMHNGKWVLKRNRKSPGKWRGCADMTPAMAEAIDHDGWDKVSVWQL